MSISRRDALKKMLALGASGAATQVFGKELRSPGPDTAPVVVENPREAYPDTQTTEDIYRKEFAETLGNPEEKGFAYHCVNCQGNCAWEVWTKDGKVTRENQSAKYPSIAPDIPDYNPRGCNKGVQHSQIMYEQDRLLYPMKRVGERGEGKWKRISWDQAVTEVAQHLYDTMLEKGPAGNYIHIGAGVLTEARAASIKRLGTLLGAVRPYIASYVGDMFPGVSVVYGEGNIGCTYDFIYTTDVAVFWGCNPNVSRIPDAHFLWEGKYRGSKIVVITPEYNATCIHADLWVPLKAGYDGHLALSIVHEILQKNLYSESFLKEYTDLPFLVRKDTRELLRLSDVDVDHSGFDKNFADILKKAPSKKEAHDHEVFLAFNKKTGKIVPMPGCEGSRIETLRLKENVWEIDPALDGRRTVRLKDGKEVKCVTVFELFREEVKRYDAKKIHTEMGVHPSIVEELARDLTKSPNALITMGFSVGKHFNGMLSQRAIATLTAVMGKLGPYGGLNTENEWNITGLQGLSGFDGRYQHRFASGFVSEFMLGDALKDYDELYSDEDVRQATGFSKADYRKKVEELLKVSANDEGYQKGKSYWTESETFLLFADARFRRNKGGYRDAFLKKAKFLAYGDYRMSDFAMYADILLPCKSHYEVWDIRTNPGYHRFANVANPPLKLKNVGETKSEWEIATLLVEKIQALAESKFKSTGNSRFVEIPDKTHTKEGVRPLRQLVKEFTLDGKLRNDRDAVDYALEHVDQFKPNSRETMYKRGGFLQLNEKAGKSSPLYKNRPYNTFESNLFLHQRFETLSGRLTFYVDHHLWLESNVGIPTARSPIRPKRYPFILMTPHARWSIHSTYKTSPILLRLQRGKPYIMLNSDIAAQRGIKDGDTVRMFNDLASVEAMVKVTPSAPPDAVVMEHGWEPFMYKGKVGHNQLAGDMINLLELSDGWGHLKFGTNWDGNQHAYDTTIEIQKV